jgi:ribonuclease BN (tRNA processing enzyme)
MMAPHFPVELADVRSKLSWREVRPAETFEIGEARIRAARLNHPGGVTAYRIEHQGRSIVYATDTEHDACVDPALRELCRNADVLIYDAQYTPDEYKTKVGWGHSTYVAGCEVAREAGVSKLILFHHDPTRTDDGVERIEALANELFVGTIAAREGMEIELGPVGLSRAA